MYNVNIDMVQDNNLNIDDLVVLSNIELIFEEKGINNKCIISYKEIINDLPIIFNSQSDVSNVTKLRKILNKEGIQKFVTRETRQQGRGKGAAVTFTINKENMKKLNVKGLVSN